MAYIDMELDIQGMVSPHPMLETLRAMDGLNSGQVLKVTTTESRAVNNMQVLCFQLGHKLIEIVDWDGEYTFLLQKA